MKSSKYLVLLTIPLAFACGPEKMNGDHRNSIVEISDSLRLELTRIYEDGLVNGFSCALVNQDRILFAEGFGYSNKKDKKPYTANTIQQVASISKTFVGLALLKAQEMGKLNIDDPVNKYLPFDVRNPYFSDDPITIRQLATHTSSISDTEEYNLSFTLHEDPKELEEYPAEIIKEFHTPNDTLTLYTFLKGLLSKSGKWYKPSNFLNARPGTTFEYSNLGACLAALIVELATDQNYDDFTKQHLIEKAGMTSSGWRSSDLDRNNLSALYASTDQEYPEYYKLSYPDGELMTSANDLANYLMELIKAYDGKGTLLEVDSYKAFFGDRNMDTTLINSTDIGPFMAVMHDEGVFTSYTSNDYIGHTGKDYGVVTAMFLNPRTKMGRLLIINTDLNFGREEELNYLWKLWNKLGEYEAKYYQSLLVGNSKNEYVKIKQKASRSTKSANSPSYIAHKLVEAANGLFIEDFDSTVNTLDKYNRDNKIFIEEATFKYSYEYMKNNESYYYKLSSDSWELVPEKEADDQTTTSFIIKVPKSYKENYPQTVINYYFPPNLSYNSTGVIENEGNVWLHPPRKALFGILELNPFPYIKAPFEVGNNWKWELRIGSYWSDERWRKWEGTITNIYYYEITGKKAIKTPFKEIDCLEIVATASSELGKTHLTSYFNPEYGFVKLDYNNIDGSKINILQTEVTKYRIGVGQ